MIHMIKAILLDVDNTLLDFNKCAELSMHKAEKRLGVTLPADISCVFHRVNAELWKQIEDGTLTREELHRIRWKKVFELCNIDGDGEKFEELFVSGIAECAVPIDGALDLLEYLFPKYDLYVASNAAYDQQVSRLTLAGMLKYMKGLFVSEKIGAAKPNEAFFDFCMKNIGENIRRDEVMMIGDSLDADITGAYEFGLKTCFFAPADNACESDDIADYKVGTLSEIKNIL